mmetsp:Transcript_1339/g.1888  ORF Transcript_1339/g.1888 Transcript_1339/m.1888 type:complete len:150 (+) Transcript_1339:48-497(+)
MSSEKEPNFHSFLHFDSISCSPKLIKLSFHYAVCGLMMLNAWWSLERSIQGYYTISGTRSKGPSSAATTATTTTTGAADGASHHNDWLALSSPAFSILATTAAAAVGTLSLSFSSIGGGGLTFSDSLLRQNHALYPLVKGLKADDIFNR